MPRSSTRPSRARIALSLLLSVIALVCLAPAAARAGVANAGVADTAPDPLAGLTWQPYQGPEDSLWTAYTHASARRRHLLANLVSQPRAQFFGPWIHNDQIRSAASELVQGTQRGDSDALTMVDTFELAPWEGAWSGQGSWSVSSDEGWYRGLAAGLGNAPAMVVLQVDLPFAARTSNQAPEMIDRYAGRLLSAHAHTTVYLDAGADEWLSPAAQGALLIANGITSDRGFSVNDTQYGSTNDEITYGGQILAYLDAHGIRGKHFIVNTAQNGQPYLAGQVSGNSNDTPRCAGATQTLCQRTGIPPTTDVTNRRWHLGPAESTVARDAVDGFVWTSQPWNVNGGGLNIGYALDLAANGEY